MEYEQKYKDALECIQEILESGKDLIRIKNLKLKLEPFFPELKESDDERLRKTTISFLKEFADKGYENAVECIAWLEKQGDYTTYNEKHIADVFEKVGLAQIVRDIKYNRLTEALQDAMIELAKKGEQKPAEWSEEDEKEVAVLEAYIHSRDWSDRHIDRALGIVDKLVNRLKSLRPQNNWKPSEEQLETLSAMILNGSVSYVNQDAKLIESYNDLKKLKS